MRANRTGEVNRSVEERENAHSQTIIVRRLRNCLFFLLLTIRRVTNGWHHKTYGISCASVPFRSLDAGTGVYTALTLPFVIAQVMLAVATVKELSLRMLFWLSCAFALVGHSISTVAFQVSEDAGQVNKAVMLLSFVLPVLILVISERYWRRASHKCGQE